MAAQRKGKIKSVPFVKMYGSGNDFVVIDCIKAKHPNIGKQAKKILNRKTGIGGDQLILIEKSKKADFKAIFYNADGSEAEMCGNGIRCAAHFMQEAKYTQKKEITFETKAGIKTVKSLGKNFRANIGEPLLIGKEIPVNLSGRIINRPLKIDGKELRITCLSMGNPHCVIFVDNVDTFPVEKFGPLLESYHLFPKRTNVEFVTPVSKEEVNMRVWERGAGETHGCGTGASAVAVAGVLNGLTERKITINQRGGKVQAEWHKESNEIELTGPSETLFRGELYA